MKKRVALICQHFYPEMISTGIHVSELFTNLSGRIGRPTRVYCAPPVYKEAGQEQMTVPTRMVHDGVEIIRVPTIGNHHGSIAERGLFALSFLVSTGFAVWRDRHQLSGIVASTNPPFIGLVATVIKWLTGLPYAVIVHDIYPDIAVRLGVFDAKSPIVWLWERITRVIFSQADALTVLGRDMEQIVRSKLSHEAQQRQRIILITNWSDERKIRPIPRADNRFAQKHYADGQFVVQYAGRMGRTHNIEPLIEAAALLKDENVLIQLIGDGAKRDQLIALAQSHELDNVQFLPYQPFDQLKYSLTAPDMSMVCLGNQFTGLSVPSKTYGMMAAGRPILAFLAADSEIGLTITENECGVVLPEPTGAQVADVIRDLMVDRAKLRTMGENGHRAFLRNHSLSSAVIRYERLMRDIFDNHADVTPAEQPLSRINNIDTVKATNRASMSPKAILLKSRGSQ